MPAPYSMDLRKRVFECLKSGMTCEEASKRFSVSISFAKSLRKLYKETGTLSPKKHGGGNPPIMNQERISYLDKEIGKCPDLSLKELCALFEERYKCRIAISTMDQNLRKYGVTRKKSSSSKSRERISKRKS